jgi:hypothetical protein
MLAALMFSMMVLTSALLLHAVAMYDARPGAQPGSASDRAPVDDSRQLAVRRGR